MKWTIDLKINVVPKQSVKGSRRGNYYTPVHIKDNSYLISYRFKEFMNDKIMIPKDVPIKLTIILHVTTNKGDIDNYCKQVWDSGNKILWYDDKQIEELHVNIKRKQITPRLYMEIEADGIF